MTLAILGSSFIAISFLVLIRLGLQALRDGISQAYKLVANVFPMILVGMVLAGMAQEILPADRVSAWMGEGSGFKGIMIGVAVGMLIPAGPYVVLPLAGSAMLAGAGYGPIAAFLTAWGVIPLHRTIVFEMPFLGARFTLARLIVNAPFPIVVGVLTPFALGLIGS